MEYSQEEIGKTIRNLRESKKWSQESLGKKLNVSGKQVSNYEKGLLCPPTDILFKLCKTFDCELGYLLGEPDYRSKTQIATAIENELGINTDSINRLKHITGHNKKCLNFGYESNTYRKIINNLLTSPDFACFIEAIYTLDHFEIEKDKIWSELDARHDPTILKQAYEYYSGPEDYEHDEAVVIPDNVSLAINDIESANDSDYSLSYSIKVSRYEVRETFERLLDSLYPNRKN